jgi:hypothetical protein
MKRHVGYFVLIVSLLSVISVPVAYGEISGNEEFHSWGWSDKEINDAYFTVFGRNPRPDELAYWKRDDVTHKFPESPSVTVLVNQLKNYFSMPEGQNELRDTIIRSYARAFNLTPTAQDFAFWVPEIKNKRMGYANLMDAHKVWLMSPQGEQYRLDMVGKVYPDVYGRPATPNEISYWNNEIKAKGYTNDQLRGFLFTWYTGTTAEQRNELLATIRRAYKQASLLPPNDRQIQNAILHVNTYHPLFNELVSWVKKVANVPVRMPSTRN